MIERQSSRTRRGRLAPTALAALLAVPAAFVGPPAANAQAPQPAVAVEKAWYTPAELLTALAQRDGIQWALPETLAGRALVGAAATTDALLDDACRQWGLT